MANFNDYLKRSIKGAAGFASANAPWLAPLGIGLAGTLLAPKLAGKAPRVPQFDDTVRAKTREQLADVTEALEVQRDRAAGDMAARGIGSSGQAAIMETMMRGGRRTLGDVARRGTVAAADAENERKRLQYGQDYNQWANRMQAWGNLFGFGAERAGEALLAKKYGVPVQQLQQFYGAGAPAPDGKPVNDAGAYSMG